jgi:hypothetical protein
MGTGWVEASGNTDAGVALVNLGTGYVDLQRFADILIWN